MGMPCFDCPTSLIFDWWKPIEKAGYILENGPDDYALVDIDGTTQKILTSSHIHRHNQNLSLYILWDKPGMKSYGIKTYKVPCLCVVGSSDRGIYDHISRILYASGCLGRNVKNHAVLFSYDMRLIDDDKDKIAEVLSEQGLQVIDMERNGNDAPDYWGEVLSKNGKGKLFAGIRIDPITLTFSGYIAFQSHSQWFSRKSVQAFETAMKSLGCNRIQKAS